MKNQPIELDQKELTIVKTQATKAVTTATELVIKDADGMRQATEILSKINQVGDMIKRRKEEITKPLNQALKSARDLFKPIELNKSNAEQIIKNKMINYQNEQDRLAREAEAKIEARVEKGTLKPETAIKKLEAVEAPEKKVEAKSGSVTFKTIQKVEITDETLIPREYLELNMVLIRRDALAGKEIPGVKIVEEKTVANSR